MEWVNGEWRVTITTDLDDQRRGEEEGRSEKGRSVRTRHGLPSSSSDVAPPSSAASKGQGKGISVSVPQVQDENPIGTATYGAGRLPIYITVWGTRYHNFMTCSSLRRSRLRRPPLSPMCVLNTDEDREAVIYSVGTGEMVHYVQNSPFGNTGRPFLRCGVCRQLDG